MRVGILATSASVNKAGCKLFKFIYFFFSVDNPQAFILE